VFGLLHPAGGVRPGDQITTVVRDHDIDGGVGRDSQRELQFVEGSRKNVRCRLVPIS
jgi:hypothetical protein